MSNLPKRDIMAEQAAKFEEFANSQGTGFLKFYKAYSMIETLHMTPDIHSDSIRRLSYLENCLKMEGFNDKGIEKINQWLIDNVEV